MNTLHPTPGTSGPEDDALAALLRDVLADTGQQFTPLPLDGDLWSRGRTDRRRHLAQVVAAAVVLLAMLLGLGALTLPDLAPVTVPRGGALPQTVHVPAPGSDEWHDNLTSTVPTGRAAVAGHLGDGVVLVVSAVDGEHRLVSLADHDSTSDGWETNGTSLSPDGWKLAYGWLRTTGPGEREAGIAVVDLRTGEEVRSAFGPAGTSGERLAESTWSPDSSSLAWRTSRFADGDQGVGGGRVGVGTPDAPIGTVRAPEPTLFDEEALGLALALSDDGMLALVASGTVAVLPDAFDPEVPWTAATTHSFSLAGEEYLEVGGAVFTDDSTRLTAGVPGGSLTFDVGDLLDGSASTPVSGTHRTWATARATPTLLGIAGASPEGTLLGVVQNSSDAGTDTLLWAAADGSDREQSLVREEPYAQSSALRFASDLADRDPVDFPAPPWARGHTRLVWLLAFGGLVAGVVLMALLRAGRLGSPRTPAWDVKDERDLWDARARRRAIGAVVRSVTAAAVLVPLLVAMAWPLRPYGGERLPAPGALPVEVAAVPDAFRFTHPTDSGIEMLEPAPFSLLQHRGDGVILTVDARNGRHRLQKLEEEPLWVHSIEPGSVALSPDGTRLAHWWTDLGETTAETSSGLGILDLTTGEDERVAVTGGFGRPVNAEEIAWSPDGAYVAWTGDEWKQIDRSATSNSGGARTLGVTRADDPDATSWRVARAGGDRALAVTNDGTVHLVFGSRMATARHSAPDAEPVRRRVGGLVGPWQRAVVDADGTTLVLGTADVSSGGLVDGGLRTLDLTDPDAGFVLHPWSRPGEGGSTVPLGWSPSGDLVVASGDPDDRRQPDTRIGVLTDGTDGPSFADVTRARSTYGSTDFSVATALVERPGVDFGLQRWPVPAERYVATALVGLAAALAVVVAARRLRRHRDA